MPRVQCAFSTCKYNSSKYADEKGECNKEDIVLTHVEAKKNGLHESLLDCKSYIYIRKEYK